jgi:hypothetical protein
VGRDPNDNERRILAVLKCNLAPATSSLSYRIVERRNIACIEWCGASELNADEILAPRSRSTPGARGGALLAAQDYLRSALATGPAPQRTIEIAASENRIAEATLRRAKNALDVRSKRQEGEWWWYLHTFATRVGTAEPATVSVCGDFGCGCLESPPTSPCPGVLVGISSVLANVLCEQPVGAAC